jgi:uncharacterized protein YdhG (YjbR/CyaY superfamily)
MTAYETTARDIDEYIARFPPEVQEILEQIRATIREAAPEAEETISYQMPTFRLQGNLVHFAAHQKHIGFYPTPSGIERFQNELSGHEVSKGTIRFPLDRPVPYDLVLKIVAFRVQENMEKAAARSKRGKQ